MLTLKDYIYRFIAYHLPNNFLYWCGMKIWINGTTGRYSNTIAPDITMSECIERLKSD